MLKSGAIARAVDLQARSDKLLLWLQNAITKGFTLSAEAIMAAEATLRERILAL
ncbi:MAG: hypothetical protein ACPGUV_12585 [Polyangiales bacterium]